MFSSERDAMNQNILSRTSIGKFMLLIHFRVATETESVCYKFSTTPSLRSLLSSQFL